MYLMNLCENIPFVFKYPYFFEDLTCKFEGWRPELQKEFESFIENLGGQVSDDAEYIFTEHLYSKDKQDRIRYYSINYLSQSIESKVPLDIDKWRFVDLEQRGNPDRLGCCCCDIRTILKAKASYSEDFNSIVCTQCSRNRNLHRSSSDGNSLSGDSSDDIRIHDSNNSIISMLNQKPVHGIDSIDRWKTKEPLNIKNLDSCSKSSSVDACGNEQIINNNVSQITNIKTEPGIHSIDRWKRTGPINFKDLDSSSDSSCNDICCKKQTVENNVSKLPNSQKPEIDVSISIDQKTNKEQKNIENSATSSKNSSQDSCSDKKMSSTETIPTQKIDDNISKISKKPNSTAPTPQHVGNIARKKRKIPEYEPFPKIYMEPITSSDEDRPDGIEIFHSYRAVTKRKRRKSDVHSTSTEKISPKVDKASSRNTKPLEVETVDLTTEETAEVIKNRSRKKKSVTDEKNRKNTLDVVKIKSTSKKTEEVKESTSKKNTDNISITLRIKNSEANVSKTIKPKRAGLKTFSDTSSESSSDDLPTIASTFKKFHFTLKNKHRKPDTQSKSTKKRSPKVDKNNSTNQTTLPVEKVSSKNKESARGEKIRSTNEMSVEVKKNRSTKKSPVINKAQSTSENTQENRKMTSPMNDDNVSKLSKNNNSEANVSKTIKPKRTGSKTFSDTSSESSSDELPSIASTFGPFCAMIKKRYRKSADSREMNDKKSPKVGKSIPTDKKTPVVEKIRSTNKKPIETEKNKSTKKPQEVEKSKNTLEVEKVKSINKQTEEVKESNSKKTSDNTSKISKNQKSEANVSKTIKPKRAGPKTFSDTSSESSSDDLPTIASTFRKFHSTLKNTHREPDAQSKSTNKKTPSVEEVRSKNKKTATGEKMSPTETIPTQKIGDNISKISKKPNSTADVGNITRKRRKIREYEPFPKIYMEPITSSDDDRPDGIETFHSYRAVTKRKRRKSDGQSKSTEKMSPKVDESDPINKKLSKKETPDVEKIATLEDETPELKIIEDISTKDKPADVIVLKDEDQELEQMSKFVPRKLLIEKDEWWINLHPGYNPDHNYKETERRQPWPEREYFDQEEREMIAFLVTRNLIDQFDRRETWRRFHREGYNRARGIDSLKTHMKEVVKNIRYYDLPREIEQRFLSLNSK